MDDLLREFLVETLESVDIVDSELVRFERNPTDREALDKIFRLMHTVKGACGFLGLSRLEMLTHAGETVLGMFRDESLDVTRGSVSLILQTIDRIKMILAAIAETGAEPAGDDSDLIEGLEEVVADPADSSCEPSDGDVDKPLAIGETDAEAHTGAQGPTADPSVQSVRVSLTLLERMMTLVGELVLTRNQLLQMMRFDGAQEVQGALQRLSGVTAELQDSAMRTRMQPIGSAWAKLPRLVRDLADELGKTLKIDLSGAETELDRQILELMKDPLVHMVRNSADHGIELPEARRAAGKDECGHIWLKAYHEGGHITIEVRDDGRGLDVERIKAKAQEQGLASAAELERMSDAEIQKFIFHAGFSTAAQVTNLSGRGVGMDVVHANIQAIGGSIDVRSSPGMGSQFTIKIPLTLAIVPALIVEAGSERFALPQLAVAEIVRTGPTADHRIELINKAPVLRLRGRLLPLVHLSKVLNLSGEDLAGMMEREASIAVAEVGNRSFGVIVDRVHDSEEIVAKPVAPILREIGLFSGNTILGDGGVIMILDPNGLAGCLARDWELDSQARIHAPIAANQDEETTSLLVFRAGDSTPKAAPLALVSRLEEVDVTAIETGESGHLLQYRGRLMPIIPLQGAALKAEGVQPVLVVGEGEESIGLAVDEIIDIVEDRLKIEVASDRVGLIGTATVNGRATGIVDVGFYLSHAYGQYELGQQTQEHRALLVDANSFFVNLLTPLLSSTGYSVTSVKSAADALRLRDGGERFDVILSDAGIEGLDGASFADAVRAHGGWRDTRLVALARHAAEARAMHERLSGFDACVSQFDLDHVIKAVAPDKERKGSAA